MTPKISLFFGAIVLVLLASYTQLSRFQAKGISMNNSPGKPLLVIVAPSIHDTYYAEIFDQIIDYDVAFANTVQGHDNILILADADTMPHFAGRVSSDLLLQADLYDIWLRDFSPLLPTNPLKFSYRPSYLEPSIARQVEDSFTRWHQKTGLSYTQQDLVLDGGNFVDNGKDKAIVTERIFLDNPNYSRSEIETLLKEATGLSEIAFIPEEAGDTTGHSDGMTMWVSENKLLVHKYEEPFRSRLQDALNSALTNVDIIEIPYTYKFGIWRDFTSACGIYLNATVTEDYIYVPTFGIPEDEAIVDLIRSHTDKTVVAIDAANVCFMGGSVRCLTWQLVGDDADRLIKLARE